MDALYSDSLTLGGVIEYEGGTNMVYRSIRLNSARIWPGADLALGVLLLVTATGGPSVMAHSPIVDSSLQDWCAGATSNTAAGGGRIEDSAAQLDCGTCSVTTNRACEVNSDCPGVETCNFAGANAKSEIVWWDNRTDGAVNDLGTVVMTWNATNLYVGAELWVDPDPASLPFGEIAIDFKSGGVSDWHDPNGVLKDPGRCSVWTDRACTTNADCAFCGTSDEPTGGCSITTSKSCVTAVQCPVGESCIHRIRACGSGCDVGDACNNIQTCVGLGAAGRKAAIGRNGSPEGKAEFMLLFDFSFWLAGTGDAVQVMRPRTVNDPVDPSTPWVPVTGCTPDFAGDNTNCDFAPAVNPGQSGGSGGPPGSVEVAIPWSVFGCADCPSGFTSGVPFRFTMTVARGNLAFPVGGQDFKPDGAHEDVLSEAVARTTTTSTNSCPGMGVVTTFCELADGSVDAFVRKATVLGSETAPGGRIVGLTGTKAGASITLNWLPSCSAGDTDYEVYEGLMGSWASHVPVTCSTAGATTATFPPASGNRYYLVVPRNATNEGSYGKNSASVERPVSSSFCVPQVLGTCP